MIIRIRHRGNVKEPVISSWAIKEDDKDEQMSVEDFLEDYGTLLLTIEDKDYYMVNGLNLEDIPCPDGVVFNISRFTYKENYIVEVEH